MRIRVKLALVCVAILSVSFLALRQSEDVVVIRRARGTEEVSVVAAIDGLSANYLSVATMAAFAANVYGPELNHPGGCADENGLIPIPEGWEQLRGEFMPIQEGTAESGFKYEHWAYPVFQDDPDSDDVYTVIAFAGTEGLNDWCTNLRSLGCVSEYDQYEQAVSAVNHVVGLAYDELAGPYLKPVAVGHSLGGGLAELAGLLHDKVYPVYAFDPSPVIGVDAVFAEDLELEGAGGGPTYRIFEHGEILAYVRLLKRWFLGRPNPWGEVIEEYRFNLLSGNPINQHSIQDLACRLRQLENEAFAP